MKPFKEFLSEARTGIVTVYHGDNHGTTKLDPKLMNNGNNQEGVGIYFTDLPETARYYGSNIIQATINLKNFLDSRDFLSEISPQKIKKVMIDMWKADEEAMFYYLSNYIEVSEPNKIHSSHFSEMYTYLKDEEIRNFQIEMADIDVEMFVASWNKHVKIDGLYHKQNDDDTWYSIINTNIKVEPYVE